MRFLVDQHLPRALARWIAAQSGCEALHIRDLSMETAEDAEIWREAQRLTCVIVTKDEDFSVIPRRENDPIVVWVRLGNCGNALLLRRFADHWPMLLNELRAGAPLIELR